jgi:hypothetical protein
MDSIHESIFYGCFPKKQQCYSTSASSWHILPCLCPIAFGFDIQIIHVNLHHLIKKFEI